MKLWKKSTSAKQAKVKKIRRVPWTPAWLHTLNKCCVFLSHSCPWVVIFNKFASRFKIHFVCKKIYLCTGIIKCIMFSKTEIFFIFRQICWTKFAYFCPILLSVINMSSFWVFIVNCILWTCIGVLLYFQSMYAKRNNLDLGHDFVTKLIRLTNAF